MLSLRSYMFWLLLLVAPSATAANEADSRKAAETFIRAVLDNKAQPIIDLLKKGANVNQVTGTGQSILCAASMLGKVEAATVLINHGATLLDSCLVTAVANGQLEMVRLFLDRGKSPNTDTGEHGDTLLHMAVRSGYVELVELLLARGADASRKNTAGETAADIASDGLAIMQAISELLGQAARP